jgi:hypothetical protein
MTGGGKDVCEQSLPVERGAETLPFFIGAINRRKGKIKCQQLRQQTWPMPLSSL